MLDAFVNIFASIRIMDILDIVIVSYLLFKVLEFIKETRARQLLRGVIILLVTFLLSEGLELNLLNWLLRSLITMGMFAVIVIFQPELRRGLEHIGHKTSFVDQKNKSSLEDQCDGLINEIVVAVVDMASEKTGALIAIERNTMLTDIIEKGNIVDAAITTRLLENLFYKGSPLHDGAIVIRGDRVAAASCVLPLTDRLSIGGNLGTRHRAGLGLSEISDALVIIVSEESGAISVAENGQLIRFLNSASLTKKLKEVYEPNAMKRNHGFMHRLMAPFGRLIFPSSKEFSNKESGGESDE